jgi:hypothetical protein
MKPITAALLCLLFYAGTGHAQSRKLKVYLDCSSRWCDETYVRSKTKAVDYTLDRLAADVDIKLISQVTGNEGEQFYVIFIGQNRFKGEYDTLNYSIPPGGTDDESRKKFFEYIGFGLSKYLIRCGLLTCVTIDLSAEGDTDNDTTIQDHWRNWVISLGTDGNFSSEHSYDNFYMSNYLITKKITDSLKIIFKIVHTLSSTTYRYEDNGAPVVIKNLNSNYSISQLYAKSFSRKWAYGYGVNYVHNTFNNTEHLITAGPSLEYNIFPYNESSSRYVTIRYSIKGAYYDFMDMTLFDKLSDFFIIQAIVSNMAFNQKWGTLNFGLGWYNSLKDWQTNRLDVNTYADIRAGGGFSFYVGIFGGLVHDQIYLPKAGATAEEILTKKRALRSDYSISGYFGFSYLFGSKTNNYVNERFNGYGYY